MRHHKLYTHPGSQSATLVLTRSGQTYFVDSVLSCLPASDIVLYSVSSLPRITPSTSSSERSERPEKRGREIQTLPVNPYPAPENTPTHVHLVAFPDTSVGLTTRSPAAGSNAKSISWLLGIKSSKTVVESEWVKGRVLGYRDRAGREAHVSFHIASTFDLMPSVTLCLNWAVRIIIMTNFTGGPPHALNCFHNSHSLARMTTSLTSSIILYPLPGHQALQSSTLTRALSSASSQEQQWPIASKVEEDLAHQPKHFSR